MENIFKLCKVWILFRNTLPLFGKILKYVKYLKKNNGK